VPYADFNALKLQLGTEHEADFILLAGQLHNTHHCRGVPETDHYKDIFLRGWHGIEISGFQLGDSVAVFSAGPVGLLTAYSTQLRGASRVFVVDRVPERLRAAERLGTIPIDFTKSDTVDQIIAINGDTADRSVDAVGYQAVGKDNSTEVPNIVLENMIGVTRACGGLGIPGLYVLRYEELTLNK
jgi:threonine dehydrogenase-like Zn-dependent dehydrogenase